MESEKWFMLNSRVGGKMECFNTTFESKVAPAPNSSGLK
jgi:hypothetical protein